MNILNPPQIELLRDFKNDVGLLTCAFASQGSTVFLGAREPGAKFVDLSEPESVAQTLEGHATWVTAIAAFPDHVVTADYAGTLICWSLESESPTPRWTKNSVSIRCLATNSTAGIVASSGTDGQVRLWDAENGATIRVLGEAAFPVFDLAFSPDGSFLFSVDRAPSNPAVRQWNTSTGELAGSFDGSDLSAYRRGENVQWGGIRGIDVSADGTQIACCGRHQYNGPGTVLLFDVASGQQTAKQVSEFPGLFHAVQYHPDGFLVTAGGDVNRGEVWFFPADGAPAIGKAPVSGPVMCLDLSPDGRQFAAAQSVGQSAYPDGGALGIYSLQPTAAANSSVPPDEPS